MKESKFIELLNLYVDHEITPAAAELLEAEVRGNPEHRRVYRQYCQMQKGCTELAGSFRSQAPATSPKLVEFAPRRRVWGAGTYAAGLAAVAACAVLVFGVRSRLNERTVVTPASVQRPIAASLNAPMAPMVRNIVSRPELQPVFGPRRLTLRGQNAELAEAAPATDPLALGDWMNSIQLSSLQGVSPEELRFDARATLRPEARAERTARPFQGKAEWTAFTFQK
jgi:hypothetical protein